MRVEPVGVSWSGCRVLCLEGHSGSNFRVSGFGSRVQAAGISVERAARRDEGREWDIATQTGASVMEATEVPETLLTES